MTHEEKLEALQAEFARQTEALAAASKQLAAMGDVELGIPREVLEQMDEACRVRVSGAVNLVALRA
jgi:division protein CdvB (Snf7/Vps24/ESCRT-III family)